MSLPASLIDTPMYDSSGKLAFAWLMKFGQIGETAPVQALLYGTSAQRVAANRAELPDGVLWYETDTEDFYRLEYGAQSADWVALNLATLDDLAEMVEFGGHGVRPDASGILDGAFYVETDRGEVIYQNQGGAWHYCAGTMWDTMVPDHRPTDLGVNDAGFDYRSTDVPPREFIWSGSAWVEITASQTPWLSNIDGANHGLDNVSHIGIGRSTTLPFHIKVGADQDFYCFSSGGQVAIGTANDATSVAVPLQVYASVVLLQPAGGNVGIGRSPSYALDVGGDINTTTGYRQGGFVGLNTTIALAKLTTSGANGSITVRGGIITGYTAPT